MFAIYISNEVFVKNIVDQLNYHFRALEPKRTRNRQKAGRLEMISDRPGTRNLEYALRDQ